MGLEIDHYKVLGLASGERATEQEITRAYKLKALKLHPDKNPDDPHATEKFQRLLSSYQFLLQGQGNQLEEEEPDQEETGEKKQGRRKRNSKEEKARRREEEKMKQRRRKKKEESRRKEEMEQARKREERKRKEARENAEKERLAQEEAKQRAREERERRKEQRSEEAIRRDEEEAERRRQMGEEAHRKEAERRRMAAEAHRKEAERRRMAAEARRKDAERRRADPLWRKYMSPDEIEEATDRLAEDYARRLPRATRIVLGDLSYPVLVLPVQSAQANDFPPGNQQASSGNSREWLIWLELVTTYKAYEDSVLEKLQKVGTWLP
ncbi:unnamed protein product [Linum trigynum]|uniref:J domain-containing protein n=1 Tax=Linum trigynum TaxID=586398 RepID=A0AAV2FIN1_9ROSI